MGIGLTELRSIDLASDEYVDRLAGNYNTIPGATVREVASPIGSDGINYDYSAIGIQPDALSQPDEGDVKLNVSYASGTKTGTGANIPSGGGASMMYSKVGRLN
jgi:hypothetical protein